MFELKFSKISNKYFLVYPDEYTATQDAWLWHDIMGMSLVCFDGYCNAWGYDDELE